MYRCSVENKVLLPSTLRAEETRPAGELAPDPCKGLFPQDVGPSHYREGTMQPPGDSECGGLDTLRM